MINGFQGKNRFLSNFYIVPIQYDGIIYPSTEHAYQACKTLNITQRKYIANLASPGMAKRYGKKIKLRQDWEVVKVDIMYKLLKIKFSKRPLAEWLRRTGNQLLTETNYWHDNFWGECECQKCKNAHKQGKNVLGKLLMKVREEIK